MSIFLILFMVLHHSKNNINGWTIWPLTSLFLFLKSWCSPLTVESHSGCKSFCFCNLFSDSLSFLSASLKKKPKKQGNLIFISKQIKKRNWNDHFNQMHYRLLLSFLPHWLSADLPVSVMKNLPHIFFILISTKHIKYIFSTRICSNQTIKPSHLYSQYNNTFQFQINLKYMYS